MSWLSLRGCLREYHGLTASEWSVRDVFQRDWSEEERIELMRYIFDQFYFFGDKGIEYVEADTIDPDGSTAATIVALQNHIEIAEAIANLFLSFVKSKSTASIANVHAKAQAWTKYYLDEISKPLGTEFQLRSALDVPQLEVRGINWCDGMGPWASVLYDFRQCWSQITVRIDLDWDFWDDVAKPVRNALSELWRFCIETWWNGRWAVQFGDELPCPVEFRVVYGGGPSDWDVGIEVGDVYDTSVLEWYFDPASLKLVVTAPDSEDVVKSALVAVHEFGHMLGLRDEYAHLWFCGTDQEFLDHVGKENNDQGPMTIMRSDRFDDASFPKYYFESFATRIGGKAVPLAPGLPAFDLTAARNGRVERTAAVASLL